MAYPTIPISNRIVGWLRELHGLWRAIGNGTLRAKACGGVP
jgi:hypothetical protein